MVTHTKEIGSLLKRFVKESKLTGAVVYDTKTSKVHASTLSASRTKNIMKIRSAWQQMGEKAKKIDNAGDWNWTMVSLRRKVSFSVRIKHGLTLAGEYHPEVAPSAAIEDALEMALMINDLE